MCVRSSSRSRRGTEPGQTQSGSSSPQLGAEGGGGGDEMCITVGGERRTPLPLPCITDISNAEQTLNCFSSIEHSLIHSK